MGDISSGSVKSVDVFSVDCEVEGIEYAVVLRAELPATSELKSQNKAVSVADSFCDSIAPAQGLCYSVAASKSNSSKVFLLKGCRSLVTIFPVCTSR